MIVSYLHLSKLFPKMAMLQLGELLGLPEYRCYSTAVQQAHVDGYVKSGP